MMNWRGITTMLDIYPHSRTVVGIAVCALWACAVQAENSVQLVSVTKTETGDSVVRIEMKEALTKLPASFGISSPPRIAIDLPDTKNATGKSVVDTGDPILRNINIVEANKRTRVVLNLVKQQGFDTKIDGKTIVISLLDTMSSGRTPISDLSLARFPDSSLKRSNPHSIRDVDFRRGKEGEGRVIVDLSDANTAVDVKQQGQQLVVDFMRTTLPANLARKLDVNDFITPVSSLEIRKQGENVRLIVKPKGLWEHVIYQTDNKFVLEVKPLKEDPTKLVQGGKPGYKGEKLSLNFQSVDIRAVLQVIADFTGLNIVTSDTVTGNLTLRLKDVPWDQALEIILQSKGLDMRKHGNVIRIAPLEELLTKELQEKELRRKSEGQEPLLTEVFPLKYITAQEATNILNGGSGGSVGSTANDIPNPTTPNTTNNNSGGSQASGPTIGRSRVLSPRGVVSPNPRGNSLIVKDTPTVLEEIRRLLNALDIPTRQVLIDTRIVIADDGFSRQLGTRFGFQGGYKTGNSNVGIGGTTTDSDRISSGTTPLANQTGGGAYTPMVNLPVSNATGNLALTFLNLGSGNLINIELSALEASNRGKVISNPRVITADNQKAVIEQGEEIPYVTPGSANSPATVSFKKAVLSLSVTPQITPDNRVIMTLEIKKDAKGQNVSVQGGGTVPAIDTRTVTTQIALNNGDTAVIGGIYEETQRSDMSKVPFFGDLPYVGALFRNTTKEDKRTELLIFITPRIITENMTAVR
ncbi:MAG: type IV pilus secretin PilQ [Pseudomonadota bacterium]